MKSNMLDNLQVGDILLVHASSILDECIAFLTNSKYSHAAMVVDNDPNHLSAIDLTSGGVCINNLVESKKHKIDVMRLKSNLDTEPLVERANAYMNTTQFDFPALILLGGMLISNKLHLNSIFGKVVNELLVLGCAELDNILKKCDPTNKGNELVCSQFVYQVYNDVGDDYKLNIEDGFLWNSSDNSIAKEFQHLYDEILKNDKIKNKEDESKKSEDKKAEIKKLSTVTEKHENLFGKLHKLIKNHSEDLSFSDMNTLECTPIKGNGDVVEFFMSGVIKLMYELEIDAPIESLFISAGDLRNATNLEFIDTYPLMINYE